jgi:corrinoid protein of di/trimethylamine methyltransferase
MDERNQLLKDLSDAVEELNIQKAAKLTQAALDKGLDPHDIITHGLQAGTIRVGEKYEKGEYFVPELLRAGKAMESAIDLIRPHMKKGDQKEESVRMVLGTVKGDIHHIGKNIVKLVLEANGIDVIDLGVDVPSERFIEEAMKAKAHVVGISALMTSTLPRVKEIVEMAVAQKVRDRFRIIIGGAPTDEAYARTIGADAHGKDPVMALKHIKSWTEKGQEG